MYAYEEFREQVKKELASASKQKVEDKDLSVPPKPELGDLSSSITFKFKNPKEAAGQIAAKIKPSGLIKEIKTAGPYVNFYLDFPAYAERVLAEAQKPGYGESDFGKGKKVIVEFPSVNPNKPVHIGHTRNAVLGDAVSNLLDYAGCNVVRQDLINNLGLQVAQSLWGYLHFKEKPAGKLDHFFGKQYVRVAKKMDEPEVDKQVREYMKKMEAGVAEIEKKMFEMEWACVKGQHETHERMNIFQDLLVWETDIIQSGLLEEGMKILEKSKRIYKAESGENKGCLMLKLSDLPEFEKLENPDKVLVRSDGTLTYTYKDICYHMWKFGIVKDLFKYEKKWKQKNGRYIYTTARTGAKKSFAGAEKIINVIDFRQSHPQLIVKSAFKLLGYEKEHNNYFHLAYNYVTLPKGGLSGREGTWIGYTTDEALDRAASDVAEIVKKNNPKLKEKEVAEISEKVAVGAVRFALTALDWGKELVFEWHKVLDFEGDTGPYLQYAHARTCGILKKLGRAGKADALLLVFKEEKDLIKKLAEYPAVVKEAGEQVQPHILCAYLLDLAHAFSTFYQKCPVIRADPKIRAARAQLVKATQNTLKNGLNLLGIDAPERM